MRTRMKWSDSRPSGRCLLPSGRGLPWPYILCTATVSRNAGRIRPAGLDVSSMRHTGETDRDAFGLGESVFAQRRTEPVREWPPVRGDEFNTEKVRASLTMRAVAVG